MNVADEANAASVGDTLRRAREARGETVTDVGYALKLTARQIEAMESDRFDLLPGRAFARGFLRNYARYLGLDPAALLADLDRSAAAPAVELSPLSNADGVMPSGVSSRRVQGPAAAVAGVLLLALVVGWFFDWFQMPEDDASGLDAPLIEPDESMLLPAPSVPEPDAAEAPVEPAPSSPAFDDAAVPSSSDPAAAPAAPAAPSASDPAGQSEALSPERGAGQLVFRYEGESWVEIRDASGKIIYSGTNAPGTSRTVQGQPPFALVVGNAPEVSLEYQGKPLDLAPHTRVGVARLTVE